MSFVKIFGVKFRSVSLKFVHEADNISPIAMGFFRLAVKYLHTVLFSSPTAEQPSLQRRPLFCVREGGP